MLVVLQFDSPSLTVLERMLGEGQLPALAGLRERGVWHDLETPATHFAAGAFHTLYSGVELADHGLFYPFQWSAPDQRVRYTTAFEAPPPVWERLDRPGTRILALDPYESRAPLIAPAGTVISGWQFTDRVVLQPWSSTPGIRGRLEQLFGPPVAVEEVFGRSSTRDLLRLRRDLLTASGRAADAARLLLAGNRFDLTWLTFSAGHVAGHQFWDLSQVDDGIDAATRRVLSGALEEVYQSVDAGFGRVLAALPEGTDVIVVSPVGMEVNTSRADLLPEMLDAVLFDGSRPDAGSGSGSVWKLRAALPIGLRSRVAAALPDRLALALTARLELRGQDWSSTRAFAHPADNQGYVRLNLRGRERDGIVSAAEAEPLLDQIASGLLTFHDPDGTPSVKAVEKVVDTFDSGIHSDRLPDLIVRWNDRPATRLEAVHSGQFGTVRRRGSGSGRSGNHTAGDAWALVVPGASRPRIPERPPRLVDIAATAAALAGSDPTDLPGEPLLQR